MSTNVQAESVVSLTANAVRIHGESVILLSASLFYFRIPHELWRERLEQLKAIGYNSIDVYIPWNFHELQEGLWDFTGMRDVERFLRLAAESGLWVIARPGPYICSEWDGGGLPAYLYAKEPAIKLRDHDPSFLEQVARWYDRILPMISRYQAGKGGSVICVQLENELDFYGCTDPKAYMTALRDMALTRGITVPLIACAGQGGLLQASGLTAGVVPTCNFYPDDRDPVFEDKVLHYGRTLAAMNYPLLVTETNRSHYLLRRLLSAGAKLLGPYLQVSGTNFGFTNATNNWGRPLAFLTSDYDFGGMISPEGHLRDEAYEGRLLARMIRTYGRALAEAEVELGTDWSPRGEMGNLFGPFALRLQGGGSLLFLTNGDDTPKSISLQKEGAQPVPAAGTLTLAPARSIALPLDVPLALWGMPGRLVSSTAELYMAQQQAEGTVLAFYADGGGAELVLEVDVPVLAEETKGAVVLRQDGQEVITVEDTENGAAFCRMRLEDGRILTVIISDRMTALHAEIVSLTGKSEGSDPPPYPEAPEAMASPEWRLTAMEGGTPSRQSRTVMAGGDRAEYLERLGVYRGYAWYDTSVSMPAGQKVQGLLVRQASDVISLYADGRYVGTVIPGGGSAFVPVKEGAESGKAGNPLALQARLEIWGHTNFDDLRLPGLRLDALKGLRGLTAITEVWDITSNWRVHPVSDGKVGDTAAAPMDETLWPWVSFGGWLSSDHPSHEMFHRHFDASPDCTSWTIHFQGLQALAKLSVNGKEAATIHPFDPFIDLTPYITPGETVQLTVHLQRILGHPAGRVIVYGGIEAAGFTIKAAEEPELGAAAETARDAAKPQSLPVSLAPGEMGWLLSNSLINSKAGKGWRVRVTGTGMKLTVFLGERIVGRLWLPQAAGKPIMTGGSPDSFYLPGPWLGGGGGRLSILLEAVDSQAPGRLETLDFIPL